MTAKITFTCTRCGEQIVTYDAERALAWDREHDSVCIALRPPPPPAEGP